MSDVVDESVQVLELAPLVAVIETFFAVFGQFEAGLGRYAEQLGRYVALCRIDASEYAV